MAIPNAPKKLWETPDIYTLDVGTTAQNMPDSEKTALWEKYSSNSKSIDTAILPNLLYDIFTQTLKEKDASASVPKMSALQDQLQGVSNWIIDSKVNENSTGSSRVSEITKLQYKSQFPLWVLEAGRKRVKVEHPSAKLLVGGTVGIKSDEFAENTDVARSQQFADQRYERAHSEQEEAKIGKLHNPTQSLFFSQKVQTGYLITKNVYLYNDADLRIRSQINGGKMIAKGSVLGGPAAFGLDLSQRRSVEVCEPEPLTGYVAANSVNEIDISDPKWKFEYSNVVFDSETSDMQGKSGKSGKGLHQQSGSQTNLNNEDEKMSTEERTCDLGNPGDPQARKALLNTYKDKVQVILQTNAKDRTPDQVMTLWTSAFNTHDIVALAECYSNTVVSQQLVDQQLIGRDQVLATFKQMFESSSDVGLNVTNKIVTKDVVVLEWKAFGTKTPSPSVSETDSPRGQSSAPPPKYNFAPEDGQVGAAVAGARFINGCGIFHIQQGRIAAQRLFWDQDVNWFSEMGVLKLPLSELHPILYGNRGVPPQILQLINANTDAEASLDAGSIEDGDSLEYELLERRGLLMRDLRSARNDSMTRKKRQFMTGLFWVSVGIMFAYVVPKYLNKKRQFPFGGL